jgi:hypothetical protein
MSPNAGFAACAWRPGRAHRSIYPSVGAVTLDFDLLPTPPGSARSP